MSLLALGLFAHNFPAVRAAPAPGSEPGDLDPTFGTGGIVFTDFEGKADTIADAVLQPDGKILVAGKAERASPGSPEYFALARYNPDGSLDATFDGDGKVVLDFSEGASALLLQPDGRIVILGRSLVGAYSELRLVRLLPDGSLDGTFGAGGTIVTNLQRYIYSARLGRQADGKLVVAGHTTDWLLLRFTEAGEPDATFGTGGIVTTNLGGSERLEALLVQPDDKIVLGGSTGRPGAFGALALARYLRDGTLDPSFGSGGILMPPTPEDGTGLIAALVPST